MHKWLRKLIFKETKQIYNSKEVKSTSQAELNTFVPESEALPPSFGISVVVVSAMHKQTIIHFMLNYHIWKLSLDVWGPWSFPWHYRFTFRNIHVLMPSTTNQKLKDKMQKNLGQKINVMSSPDVAVVVVV